MKNKFPHVPIAVDRKRTKGIEKLKEKVENLKVVVLDDAFQHRYVKPGLSILLTDFNRPFTNDFLLPVGRLRESFHEKRRANVVIITKTPDDVKPMDKRIFKKKLKLYPYQRIFFTGYEYGLPKEVSLNNKQTNKNLQLNSDHAILLVTGIADASSLKNHLTSYYTKNIHHIQFADHHKYTEKDIIRIKHRFEKIPETPKIILTTEKDAVRFQDINNSEIFDELPLYYIPVKVKFIDGNQQEFDELIRRYVKENKISILHK
jgi:tetraacyldisaccharide 4'-kinase